MILDVHERLALMNMLPKEGGYEELKTIRRAKEMLSFDDEETKLLSLRQDTDANGRPIVQWDTTQANQVVKDIPMDEWTTNHFRKQLAEMDNKGKLNEQHLSVYEKFVIMYK